MSHAHRQRANRRPMYQEFIRYISKNEFDKNFSIEKGNSLNYFNINLQLESIIYFNKQNLLKNMIDKSHEDLIRKKKFNGKKFIELGIKDKDISIYIEKFKKMIEIEYNMNFQKWLDKNDSKTIDLILNNFITKYNK